MHTVVDVSSRATGISFRQIDVVSLSVAWDAAVACRAVEDAHACHARCKTEEQKT